MDCSQFKSNILFYSESSLSGDLSQETMDHIASCNSCAQLFSQFNAMEIIIEHDKLAEPSPFVGTRILQHIDNESAKRQSEFTPFWIRVLQPVALAIALLCGIFIGSYTASKDNASSNQIVNVSENVEFLKTDLFISTFADEDKILVLNQ
jgi:hypothetical protein